MLGAVLGACGGTDEAPTFYGEVQPVVEQHCVRCHRPGGAGFGDFTDPAVVEELSELMLGAIDDGRMPPPASDPACHDYVGSEAMHLPAEGRDTLAAWIDAGKQRGDPATAGTYDRVLQELEDPDLEVRLQQPYTPAFDDTRNPGNEYRCFALEHGRTEPFFVTALHPIVDQPSLVHHVVLAKVPFDEIEPGADRPEGVDCIDGAAGLFGGDDGDLDVTTGSAMLAAWAPGMEPIVLEGGGLPVRPEDRLVLQIHYFASGDDPPPDRSGYAFRTATAVDEVVIMAPLGTYDFLIPAGDDDYTVSDEISIPIGLKLWGVFPHMHVLGKGYRMSIGEEDDETCIVASDAYDFANQLTYQFDEPISIPANTPIRFSCTWDNSVGNADRILDTPVATGPGERTDEEMCFLFSLISFRF